MSTIEDVFEGEWKSPDEYLIKCPYCGDHRTHNHCYVNVVKGMFICHRCSEAGTIERLVEDHGDGEEIEPVPGMVEKRRYDEVKITDFKPITGMSGPMDRLALSYLKGRGVTRELIDIYGIRFSDFGRYYGRVIFPVVEKSDTVCFIARSFLEEAKPKYLFPHHGETLLTSNECVWGLNHAQIYTNIVIVEGVLDAIRVTQFAPLNIGAVSLHSKQMGEAQLLKLLKLPHDPKFIVMLDGDAYKDGLKVAGKLKTFGRNVTMALLDKDEDPGDMIKERLEEVLKFRTFPVNANLAVKVYLGG